MRGRPVASGFSVLEALLALTLMAVVLSSVFRFVLDTSRSFNSQNSTRETQQAARAVVDELSRLTEQAGYGIERPQAYNASAWQRALVHAGAHVLAFNADLDPSRGPLDGSQTATFPGGEVYLGQGPADTTDGAETYVFSIDADGDGTITLADRSAAESGSYNPAAITEDPLDFALVERVLGYDGSGYSTVIAPLAGHLFTNADATVQYADGARPAPLFTYRLTEDLNRDGRLDPFECVNDVVDSCPPGSSRLPLDYLWGDTNFDGALSDAEKTQLIGLPVGAAGWSKNPCTVSGAYKSTTLSAAVDPTSDDAYVLRVGDATRIAPGAHLRVGSGAGAETFVVEEVSTATSPDTVVLETDPQLAHPAGSTVAVLPGTLLQAVTAVQITFTAISPRKDLEGGAATLAQSGRRTSHGMDYRTFLLQKTVGLPNLKTVPLP